MTIFIVFSLTVNVFLIVIFRNLSNFINIFDKPDKNRKLHKKKTASIGGVIFFINLILFMLFVLFNNEFLNDYKVKFLNGNKQFFSFFVLSFLIFLIGIIDDKVNLSALKKSALFIFLLIFSSIDKNITIKFLNFDFLTYKILTGHLGIFLSIVSIFYFMNALNMFDGIDVQTPLYLFLLFLFLIFKSEYIVIFLIIPSIFFLMLNIKGQCFLGNSGSYFLGYIISVIFIKINQSNPNVLTSEEVLIILSLPCFELFRLFTERIMRNQNPFTGDRTHIHHLLSKKFSDITTSLITNSFIFIPLAISQFVETKIIIFILQLIIYYLLIYKFKNIKV